MFTNGVVSVDHYEWRIGFGGGKTIRVEPDWLRRAYCRNQDLEGKAEKAMIPELPSINHLLGFRFDFKKSREVWHKADPYFYN